MEPVLDITSRHTWPAASDYTPEQRLAVLAYEQTGKMPYRYQVEVALALESGQDVICIAGTGAGKSYAFILPLFLGTKIIVWIVSPLNFIENQMAQSYTDYGLAAAAVNAATITPQLISLLCKDIKKGKYNIVILSPETYHDNNKLRSALLSDELESWQHITVIDEAHVIHTWADNGFRVAYQRIGDMHIFMPPNSLMCAATATCSPDVKTGVCHALKLSDDYLSVHLGNWRANLSYGLYVMSGGRKAYHEIVDVISPFSSDGTISGLLQILIFVENYQAAYYLASELQKHYNVCGQEALVCIAVYHSLFNELTKNRNERAFQRREIRIMICTKALTMGVDFSGVGLVVNYMSPSSAEAWMQRAGRGARALAIICFCIVMVTKHTVQEAVGICKRADRAINPEFADIKVKVEAKDEDGDELNDGAQIDSQASSVALVATPTQTRPRAARRQMTLAMAEYIATADCRTKVLDREFDNPPHESCYSVCGCDLCIKARDQDEDLHCVQRQTIKTEEQEPNLAPDDELEHKLPSTKVSQSGNRTGQELKRFLDGISSWRKHMLEELKELDITKNAIMTDKALERIAKSCSIKTIADFDQPEINWQPGQPEWQHAVLELLDRLQCVEDELLEQARLAREAKKQEAALRRQAERDECKHLKQVGTQGDTDQLRTTQVARGPNALQVMLTDTGTPVQQAVPPPRQLTSCSSRTSKLHDCLAIGETVMSFSAPTTPDMQFQALNPSSSSSYVHLPAPSVFPSPISAPLTPLLGPRAIGTMQVGPGGRPYSVTPSHSSMSHPQSPQLEQSQLEAPRVMSTANSGISGWAMPHSAPPSQLATPAQFSVALPEQPATSTSTASAEPVAGPSSSRAHTRSLQNKPKPASKPRTRSRPPPQGQFRFAPQYQGPTGQ